MITLLSRLILAPIARLIYRPRIIGKANVPKRGAVLLASNHLSFIDSVVITLVAPRRVSFLAKSSYFTGTGIKGWLSRTFFTSIGAVGVVRGAGSAAQDALDKGLQVLQESHAFAIYPEGTRSLDGRLYRGRTGVAWLALTSGCPVVPVALEGTHQLQPVGTRVPRIRKISVSFGAPLDLSRHGSAGSGRARRQATDEVMRQIQLLSGQEVATGYNDPPVAPLDRVRRIFRRHPE